MTERATTVIVERMAAACRVCEWADDRAGALGRAAIHHDASGHEVVTVVTRRITYGSQAETLEALGQLSLGPGIGGA